MHRTLFTILAAVLALVGVGLVGWQWLGQATTYRVAVGPLTGEDTRLVAAITQYLTRERASVRLKLVLTEGVAGSAEAIQDDKADLAVVRTDVAMPTKAQTLAIMHRDAAVLMTTEAAAVTKLADLQGKTVGIVRNMPANERLLETALAHYEIPKADVATVFLTAPAEVEAALKGREVDAVLVVATQAGRTMTETIAAVTRAGGGPPVFIPVGEADAIAQRFPTLESVEIVRGAFGGSPPRPAEALKTIGVSHRLVGLATLDDNKVAELTRLLFAMRPAISAEVPLANRIEAPDTSKSSSLPVHPGASAYYEGEVQTFFERYGDWFYLVVMVGSIVGSAIAGVASSAAGRSRARDMARLNELLDIVHKARDAHSAEDLDALEREADDILAAALLKAGAGHLEGSSVAAFTLGLDQARRAIAERRRVVALAPRLSQAAE
jgi:TRAP transporter TAXI family solute receptor